MSSEKFLEVKIPPKKTNTDQKKEERCGIEAIASCPPPRTSLSSRDSVAGVFDAQQSLGLIVERHREGESRREVLMRHTGAHWSYSSYIIR